MSLIFDFENFAVIKIAGNLMFEAVEVDCADRLIKVGLISYC
jgi:hypothetical protein